MAIQIHTFVLCSLTALFPKYAMVAWLRVFLPELSSPLEFFILQSTNREADDVQIERTGS